MSNQVYSNNTTEYPVRADILSNNVNCINLFAQDAGCNTLFINNPSNDPLATKVLSWDFDTSVVGYVDFTPSNYITTNSVSTLTNKTLQNAILSGGTVVNNISNGTVLDISSSSLSLTGPLINISSIDGSTQSIMNITSTGTVNRINMSDTNASSFVNDITFAGTGGAAKNLQVGLNNQSSHAYLYSTGVPLLLYTNGIERLRVPLVGIATDTSTNEALVINGTTLAKRTDFVTLTGVQTITNKTISNLVSTGTLDSMLSGKITKNYITGISTVGNVASNFATATVPNNSSIIVKCWITAQCTVGADLNKFRFFDATFAAKNLAGVVTAYTVVSNNGSDAAFNVTITAIPGVGTLLIQVAGIAGNTIVYSGVYKTILQ